MNKCAYPRRDRIWADSPGKSTRALLALLVVSTHYILGPSSAAKSNAALGGASAVETPLAMAVALVEWQFPVGSSPTLPVHPLQDSLVADPNTVKLRPAFYPNLSEVSADESERALARLTQHGTRVAQAYAAGRETFTHPFLLNVSAATPAVLRVLIAAGVRVVSFSVAEKGDGRYLDWIDDLVRDFPDVLFIVGTPYIAGNSISVEELAQRPSVLAVRGHRNVLLVGMLRIYEDQVEDHRAGRRIGTAANPFSIGNQPVAATVPQVFMLNDRSTRVFADGFSGTSAAASHLAALLGLVAEHLWARGEAVAAPRLLAEFERLMHRGVAQEKTGAVRAVRYFTLDTMLVNAGQPLVTDAIWEDASADAPAPLTLNP